MKDGLAQRETSSEAIVMSRHERMRSKSGKSLSA